MLHRISAVLDGAGKPQAIRHRVVSPSHLLYVFPRATFLDLKDWPLPVAPPPQYDPMACEGLIHLLDTRGRATINTGTCSMWDEVPTTAEQRRCGAKPAIKPTISRRAACPVRQAGVLRRCGWPGMACRPASCARRCWILREGTWRPKRLSSICEPRSWWLGRGSRDEIPAETCASNRTFRTSNSSCAYTIGSNLGLLVPNRRYGQSPAGRPLTLWEVRWNGGYCVSGERQSHLAHALKQPSASWCGGEIRHFTRISQRELATNPPTFPPRYAVHPLGTLPDGRRAPRRIQKCSVFKKTREWQESGFPGTAWKYFHLTADF